MDNTVSRDVDFRCTFHHRTDTDVGLLVKVNDTRETPEAADNRFEVNAKLAKGVFTLVKLGPPQKNSQAWLAIQADKFDAPGANPILPQVEGKLPGAETSVFLRIFVGEPMGVSRVVHRIRMDVFS